MDGAVNYGSEQLRIVEDMDRKKKGLLKFYPFPLYKECLMLQLVSDDKCSGHTHYMEAKYTNSRIFIRRSPASYYEQQWDYK